MRESKKSATKLNKYTLLEYEPLKQNDLFSTIKRNTISDTLTILVHNVRPLSKHVDIVSDDTIMNNDIIKFTETNWILSILILVKMKLNFKFSLLI